MEKRQRWEYCQVDIWGEITYYVTSGDHLREHLEEFPNDRDGRVWRAAALLGEWGWEAYAIVRQGDLLLSSTSSDPLGSLICG